MHYYIKISEKSINVIRDILKTKNTGVSITSIVMSNIDDINPIRQAQAVVASLIELKIMYKKERRGHTEHYLTDKFIRYINGKDLTEENVNKFNPDA